MLKALALDALGPFALFLTSARLNPAAAFLLWLFAVPLYCMGVVPFIAEADSGHGPLWAQVAGGLFRAGIAWWVLRK